MNAYIVTDYNTEAAWAFTDPRNALQLKNLIYDTYLLADDDNTYRANKVICSMTTFCSDPIAAFEGWKIWNNPFREE